MMQSSLAVIKQWLRLWQWQETNHQGWRYVLGAGLLIQSTILILLTSTSMHLISKTETEAIRLSEVAKKLALTQTIMQTAQIRMIDLNLAINSTDPFERDKYTSDFIYRSEEFINARKDLLNMQLTSEEKRMLDEHGRLAYRLVPIMNLAIKHIWSDQIDEAKQRLEQAAPLQKKMLVALDKLTRTVETSNQKEKAKFAATLHETRKRIHMLGWAAFIMIILIASAIFYYAMSFSRKLSYRATYDELTGLLNRSEFMRRIDLAVERAKQNGYRLAIGYIDLDRFKRINNTLGHNIGDQLLAEIAKRLRRIQSGCTLLSRLGDDEFAVLWKNLKSSKELVRRVEAIFNLLMNPITLHGHELYAGCSIGISQFPHDGDSSVSLLRKADVAMYQAKRSRSGYYIYNEKLDEQGEEKLILEAEIRHAVKRNELFFLYQPQFDLKNGGLRGVESLIRWKHPTKGILSPNVFLKVMEEIGAINTVHEYLFEMAAQQLSEWGKVRSIVLGLNITNELFWSKKLFATLSGCVKNAQVSPDLLELELSENLIIDDFDHAFDIAKRLKKNGFRIALDDFGIGMSSLSYLKRLPIDCLKIDRSFIEDAPFSPRNQAFLYSILDLCHRLNIEVVAEGVETNEQLTLLRETGCHIVQGYLLGEPSPSDKITKLLIEPPQGNPRLGFGSRFAV